MKRHYNSCARHLSSVHGLPWALLRPAQPGGGGKASCNSRKGGNSTKGKGKGKAKGRDQPSGWMERAAALMCAVALRTVLL